MAFKFVPYVRPGEAGSGSGGDSTVIKVDEFPSENIDESKIYRKETTSDPTVALAGMMEGTELRMTLAEYFTMAGQPVTVYAYEVETLPETMTASTLNVSPSVMHLYILTSTGIAYLSQDGTPASAISIGAFFGGMLPEYGWVNSLNDIVINESTPPGIYSVRGGTQIAYGTPNTNGDKVLYEHTDSKGWINLTNEVAKIPSLEMQNEMLTEELNSKKEQNDRLYEENNTLENEKRALQSRIDSMFKIVYSASSTPSASYNSGKLWLKTTKPTSLVISDTPQYDDSEASFGKVERLTATLPVPRSRMVSAVVDKTIYMFGGRQEDATDVTTSVVKFDTETQIAEQLEGVVTDQYLLGAACASVGKRIYIFGGDNWRDSYATNKIRRFDTDTNEFVSLDVTFPNGLMGAECVVVDGNIRVVGGKNKRGTDSTENTATYVFDVETETLSTLSLVVIFDKTYGGVLAHVGSTLYQFGSGGGSNVRKYDITTEPNSTLYGVLPSGFEYLVGMAVGTKIYLMYNGEPPATYAQYERRVYCFDTETETIIKLYTEMPELVDSMTFQVVDGTMYMLGGAFDNSTASSNVYQLDTSKRTLLITPGLLNIITGGDNNPLTIIDDDNGSVQINISEVMLGNADGVAEPVEAYIAKNGSWMAI